MTQITVLVTDAQYLAQIAVIRSLGRAHCRIIACSSESYALGFYSYFTSIGLQHPSYHDHKEFISWLNQIIKKYHINIIIPLEPFMLTIKEQFSDYSKYLPYQMPKHHIYELFSKYYLFNFLNHKNQKHIPICYFLDQNTSDSQITDILLKAKYPLFLKADALFNQFNDPLSNHVKRLDTPDTAQYHINCLKSHYLYLLLQEYVPGIGVGVFFLRWNNKIIQYFMHKRLHEVPYTGGISTYRCSWWHEAIYQDALNKIKALNYNGIIMFEYRWSETTDEFYLIEVNSRFWGSLHLALFSGVDFPKTLLNCMKGKNNTRQLDYPINIRCRKSISSEILYVLSILRDKKSSLNMKIFSTREFFYLLLNPKVHSDLLFKQDKRLYFINSLICFFRIIPFIFRRVLKKLGLYQ